MKLRAGVFIISALLTAPMMSAGETRSASRKIAVIESIADRGATVALTLEDGSVVEVARELVRVRKGSSAQGKRVKNAKQRAQLDVAALSRANQPAAVVLLYKDDGSVRRARIHVFQSAAQAKQFATGPEKPASDR